MILSPQAYGWLLGSILAAVCLDAALMRLLLGVLKPTSAYVFWIGRFSKLAVLGGWFLFFNSYWWGAFIQTGDPLPGMAPAAEWGVWLALLLLAVVTVPRARRGRSEHA